MAEASDPAVVWEREGFQVKVWEREVEDVPGVGPYGLLVYDSATEAGVWVSVDLLDLEELACALWVHIQDRRGKMDKVERAVDDLRSHAEDGATTHYYSLMRALEDLDARLKNLEKPLGGEGE